MIGHASHLSYGCSHMLELCVRLVATHSEIVAKPWGFGSKNLELGHHVLGVRGGSDMLQHLRHMMEVSSHMLGHDSHMLEYKNHRFRMVATC